MADQDLQDKLNGLRPTPADYLPIARSIQQGAYPGLRPLKLAMLASFTAQPLQPYIVVEAAKHGLACDVYLGPFNQIETQALDPNSDLYQSQPEVLVLALRLEEISPALYYQVTDKDELQTHLDTIRGRYTDLIAGIRSLTDATVLVWNFPDPVYPASGIGERSLKCTQLDVIHDINRVLAGLCSTFPDVHVFDVHRVAGEVGLARWSDAKLLHTGRIPHGAEAQLQIGRALSRYLNAICNPPCKCLAVDLDNTIWGGAVGEDGLGGILLGEDYPGNVYKDFQRHLLMLRDRGILLAIASKNNPEDVAEVFDRHPDCLLKMDHFSAVQIGWQDKASSLRAIAGALNIGIDALAFYDDSPAEREWIRSQLPEVRCIDVPENPLEYVPALHASTAFDILTLSEEDRIRADLYRQEQSRNQFKETRLSVDDFLSGLEMQAVCGHVDVNTLPRVAQLLAKTNQLNLTTRRHSAAQLQKLMDNGALALWLRLSDRFGDHGLVGVIVGVPQLDGRWLIDTMLLSCRVIGRQAERVLLAQLGELVSQKGGRVLTGEYIPTDKNSPAEQVFRVCDFSPADTAGRLWEWDLSETQVPHPDFIPTHFEVQARG